EQVARLERLKADSLDPIAALDREEAPVRALFDASKDGAGLRHYESACEREFHRSIGDLVKLQKAAPAGGPPAPVADEEPPPAAAPGWYNRGIPPGAPTMATAPTPGLLTAEEFARRPDPGYPEELVKGRVVAMPPPKARHGQVCNKAGRILGNYAEDQDLGHV